MKDHWEVNGWTVRTIVEAIGVSEETVRKWCRENNISHRLIGDSQTKQKGYILTKEEYERFIAETPSIAKDGKIELTKKYIKDKVVIAPSDDYDVIEAQNQVITNIISANRKLKSQVDRQDKRLKLIEAHNDETRQSWGYEDEMIKDIRKRICQEYMGINGWEYNNPEYKMKQIRFFKMLDKLQKERTGLGKFTRVIYREHRTLLKFYQDLEDDWRISI